MRISFYLALFFSLTSFLSIGQKKKNNTTATPIVNAASSISPLQFAGMEYRSIGPFQGGRSLAVSGVVGDPSTYYMGATGGGVWKTEDAGGYWFSISDTTFKSSSVGALAVAPSNPNRIYVGMGEAAIRNTAIMGDGMYISDDAGKSWKHTWNLPSTAFGRIIVHPQNDAIAYAAVMGNMFGKNKERGIYQTLDGGLTWKNILFKNDSTGAIDIDFDPSNPNVLYASFWQVNRKPWKLDSGGPGCELFKSTDGGKTWKSLSKNPGMPQGVLGKMCIALSADNPQRVYALIESKSPGMYRSDDGGATWTQVSTSNDITQRPWYFSNVYADPSNANIIYVCNLELMKSIDGGKTYEKIHQEHGDNHDVWINPANGENFIVAFDGSAIITQNGGATWSDLKIPTAQFYHVNLDKDFPYHAYGGQQDWGSVRIATSSYGGSIGDRDWNYVAGGEAGYIVPQPDNSMISYGGEYDGIMTRHDLRNEQEQFVSVDPMIHDGWGAEKWTYRFAWTYPIVFSPFDPHTLFCTSNHVHKSTDDGNSWQVISPDLTTNDKSKQKQSGGVLTPDNTGAEIYCTIYAFEPSTISKNLYWAGTDDGRVHVTHDAGKTWQNITPIALPAWTTVSIIEPSSHDSMTCYFAAHAYRLGNLSPYIFKTTDGGKTWKNMVNGIRANDYVRVVREDPHVQGLLYAGTETGVYVSFNGGEQWQPLQLNLPVTPVWDLRIQKDHRDMVLATHGRGFWVLDDLTPLYHLANSKVTTSQIYPIRVSYRVEGSQTKADALKEQRIKEGVNAPNGVLINYYLQEQAKLEVRLLIIDAKGDSIIAYSSKFKPDGKPFVKEEDEKMYPKEKKEDMQLSVKKGMHRFVWDMMYPSATAPEEEYWAESSLRGPKALPGNYTAVMKVDGKEVSRQNFKIILNPNLPVDAAVQQQFALSKSIKDQQQAIVDRVKQIRSVRKQVKDFTESFADTLAWKSLEPMTKSLLDSLEAMEDTLINSKIKSYLDPLRYPYQLLERYGSLSDFVNEGDNGPTQSQLAVFETLENQRKAHFARLDRILEVQVGALNKAIEEKHLKVIDASRSIKKAP